MSDTIDVQIGFFVFETPEEERLRTAKSEVVHYVDRLGGVVARLNDVATKPLNRDNYDFYFEELEYHSLVFLTAVYEFRERLISLLALIAGCDRDSLVGKGGYQRRRKILATLPPRTFKAGEIIAGIDNKLCSSIRLRGEMTHGSGVDLCLLVDGEPYEAGAVLAQYAGDDVRFFRLRSVLQEAVNRFVAEKEVEVGAIREYCKELVAIQL